MEATASWSRNKGCSDPKVHAVSRDSIVQSPSGGQSGAKVCTSAQVIQTTVDTFRHARQMWRAGLQELALQRPRGLRSPSFLPIRSQMVVSTITTRAGAPTVRLRGSAANGNRPAMPEGVLRAFYCRALLTKRCYVVLCCRAKNNI